jgi:hypothetical protein
LRRSTSSSTKRLMNNGYITYKAKTVPAGTVFAFGREAYRSNFTQVAHILQISLDFLKKYGTI